MLPLLVRADVVNRALTDTVLGRDPVLRTPVGPDHAHLGLGELDTAMPNAARLPRLETAVGHVLGMRAEPQMLTADADRIITGVQHIHPWRDGTMLILPSCAVRP